MRLGFWNRLAIVLGGVTTVGISTLLWTDQRSSQMNSALANYEFCTNPPDGNAVNYAECARLRDSTIHNLAGADAWLDIAVVVALVCGAIYCVIWAAVAAAKWVWRGRSVNKNTETA